jgi:hypothetical protein
MKFLVELEAPPAADWETVAEYIRSAVATERGALHPEEPMFELDPNSVTVRRTRETKEIEK